MGKSASGSGNLRKKEVYRNGKEYVFWEGRATVGIDPATGKAIRRSVTAPTQKEARKKLSALICSVEAGMYQSPVNMTVAEWVKQWLEVYAINTVKPYTITSYRKILSNHIKPRIGGLNLQAVRGIQIQKFYNDLLASGLSARPFGTSQRYYIRPLIEP